MANAIVKLHKQFFCYMDEWINMPKDKIFEYDKKSCEMLNNVCLPFALHDSNFQKFLEMKKFQKKDKKSLAQLMKSKLRAKL